LFLHNWTLHPNIFDDESPGSYYSTWILSEVFEYRLGAAGYISSGDIFKIFLEILQEKTFKIFDRNSKKLGGLHPVGALFTESALHSES
jgi:hypothetical protein